jgi:Mg2+ and Co2+ transporter CorA
VAFQASQDKLLSVKHEMKVEIRSISTENTDQLLKVQDMIDKLFEYVMHLRREFSNLQDNFSQMKLQCDENEDLNSNCKKFTESLQKENKFISENIKRLAAEKMKVEKQLS